MKYYLLFILSLVLHQNSTAQFLKKISVNNDMYYGFVLNKKNNIRTDFPFGIEPLKTNGSYTLGYNLDLAYTIYKGFNAGISLNVNYTKHKYLIERSSLQYPAFITNVPMYHELEWDFNMISTGLFVSKTFQINPNISITPQFNYYFFNSFHNYNTLSYGIETIDLNKTNGIHTQLTIFGNDTLVFFNNLEEFKTLWHYNRSEHKKFLVSNYDLSLKINFKINNKFSFYVKPIYRLDNGISDISVKTQYYFQDPNKSDIRTIDNWGSFIACGFGLKYDF